MSQLSNLRLARRWIAAETQLAAGMSFDVMTRCYCASSVVRKHLAGGICGVEDLHTPGSLDELDAVLALADASWEELYVFLGDRSAARALILVNDNQDTRYTQPTARARALAYLDDAIAALETT